MTDRPLVARRIAVIALALANVGCASRSDFCDTQAPYDSSRYDAWLKERVEKGCPDAQPQGNHDTTNAA